MQSASVTVLAFVIGGQRFGIGLDDIQEVVRAVELARLPKAPRVVEGLIDLRGSVVPVLDIRSRFRLSPKPIGPGDHLIIARARGATVGLRVDCAVDILPLPTDAIDGFDTAGAPNEYVAGVARLPDGLLLIHDLATFLSEAEARSLAELAEEGLSP